MSWFEITISEIRPTNVLLKFSAERIQISPTAPLVFSKSEACLSEKTKLPEVKDFHWSVYFQRSPSDYNGVETGNHQFSVLTILVPRATRALWRPDEGVVSCWNRCFHIAKSMFVMFLWARLKYMWVLWATNLVNRSRLWPSLAACLHGRLMNASFCLSLPFLIFSCVLEVSLECLSIPEPVSMFSIALWH